MCAVCGRAYADDGLVTKDMPTKVHAVWELPGKTVTVQEEGGVMAVPRAAGREAVPAAQREYLALSRRTWHRRGLRDAVAAYAARSQRTWCVR